MSSSTNHHSCETSSSSSESYSNASSFSYFSSDLDLDGVFGTECQCSPGAKSLKTFKVVGDNLNKNVNPSDVRSDNQTRSLNYFHTYAVRDRLDLTNHDDTPP